MSKSGVLRVEPCHGDRRRDVLLRHVEPRKVKINPDARAAVDAIAGRAGDHAAAFRSARARGMLAPRIARLLDAGWTADEVAEAALAGDWPRRVKYAPALVARRLDDVDPDDGLREQRLAAAQRLGLLRAREGMPAEDVADEARGRWPDDPDAQRAMIAGHAEDDWWSRPVTPGPDSPRWWG